MQSAWIFFYNGEGATGWDIKTDSLRAQAWTSLRDGPEAVVNSEVLRQMDPNITRPSFWEGPQIRPR